MGFLSSIGKAISGGLGNVLGSVVSGIGSVVSTKMSNHAAKDAQKREQRYMQENMALQNQYNIEAFERENAYNAPVAQRERMREAGLNPNFTDGSQAIAQQDSNVSASAPKQQVFPFDFSQIANAAATFASIKRENELAQSQKDLNNTQMEVNKSTEAKNYADASSAENNIQFMYDYEGPQILKNIEVLHKQIDDLESQIQSRTSSSEIGYRQVAALENKTVQDIIESGVRVESLQQAMEVIEKRLPHELNNLDADTKSKIAQSVLNQVLAKYEPWKVAIQQQEANTHARGVTLSYLVAHESNIETSRHNKAQENLSKALNDAMIENYREDSSNKRVQNELLSGQVYYQNLYNRVQYALEQAGVQVATANAVLWKLQADKEYIQNQTFESQQRQRMFEDTYFGQLYNAYLPHIFSGK